MSKEYRFLDIGGGPDISEDPDEISKLRGVLLARTNTSGQYFILDPNLPDPLRRKQISDELPNVFFVPEGIALNKQLPFADGVFDTVEMNFTFVTLAGAQGNNILSVEDFENWRRKHLALSDVPLFLKALTEGSRVLKKEGELIVCEKQQRMIKVLSLLQQRSDFYPQGILRKNNLVIADLTEIDDRTRSWWTRKRINDRTRYLEQATEEKAEENRVFALKLIKI